MSYIDEINVALQCESQVRYQFVSPYWRNKMVVQWGNRLTSCSLQESLLKSVTKQIQCQEVSEV